MGFRFRKSFKVAPGLRVNLSKRGVGARVGRRGAGYSVGPSGRRASVGIPGTGVSYQTKTSGRHARRSCLGLFVMLPLMALFAAWIALAGCKKP